MIVYHHNGCSSGHISPAIWGVSSRFTANFSPSVACLALPSLLKASQWEGSFRLSFSLSPLRVFSNRVLSSSSGEHLGAMLIPCIVLWNFWVFFDPRLERRCTHPTLGFCLITYSFWELLSTQARPLPSNSFFLKKYVLKLVRKIGFHMALTFFLSVNPPRAPCKYLLIHRFCSIDLVFSLILF